MVVLPLLIGSLGFSFQSLAENTQMRLVNAEDFTQIVRVIIDHPNLQKYFHAELPGRSPLKVLKQESFPEKLPLSKFGVPVDYLKREELRKGDEAYLDFKKIGLENDKAVLEFKYPVEGVAGKVELSKQHGAWAIEKFEIVER
jgi:hypothetical protein